MKKKLVRFELTKIKISNNDFKIELDLTCLWQVVFRRTKTKEKNIIQEVVNYPRIERF